MERGQEPSELSSFLTKNRRGVRTAIRTSLLALAGALGLSGDFIGTFDSSSAAQRTWIFLTFTLILAAHAGVEVFSTRSDRRVRRDLDEQYDRLAELSRQKDAVQKEKEAAEKRLAEIEGQKSLSEQEKERLRSEIQSLRWLQSEEGRKALAGIQAFADRLLPSDDDASESASDREATSTPEPSKRPVTDSTNKLFLETVIGFGVGLAVVVVLVSVVLGLDLLVN
ncbi:hypothetical protein [Salinactinospora qingdaonensis]|uniref:Uncharacterized protein n=1 Tax=Salinactinospora qingdaonensis TaxID=702744 RepID=A0ABP7GIN1_9ACTN